MKTIQEKALSVLREILCSYLMTGEVRPTLFMSAQEVLIEAGWADPEFALQQYLDQATEAEG